MKLKRKPQQLTSQTFKVTLDGKMTKQLTQYQHYYETIYQEKISSDDLIAEMVANFIISDREFIRWSHVNEIKSAPQE